MILYHGNYLGPGAQNLRDNEEFVAANQVTA